MEMDFARFAGEDNSFILPSFASHQYIEKGNATSRTKSDKTLYNVSR